MKVLALCSYPKESAATRFRLEQYVRPLSDQGIDLDIRPFLTSKQFTEFYDRKGIVTKAIGMLPPIFRRIKELALINKYDLILVQREAMFFGPGIFECLYQTIGRLPLILDLDDATYVRYVSPTYGRLGSVFKFFGKTDGLIRRADLIICGNRFIAEYAESKGAKAVIIPTVVDTQEFTPKERDNDPPIVGWIGTHSTFSFLESLFPVLEDLSKTHRFRLRIVGAGRKDVNIGGLEVESLEWRLDREIDDFRSFDIGLYPITLSRSANEQWILGKSGFKAIQYLAVGVPFVMSPIGVCAEIGEVEKTHFNAATPEDWYNSLSRLIADAELRKSMGENGRRYSLEHYRVSDHASVLADAMKSVGAVDRRSGKVA